MKSIIYLFLITSILFASSQYDGSSTAPVILAGAVIKSLNNEPEKKYPRKNCPVCKGAGKYLSGDGIKMVDCGYCIPDKENK